MGLWAWSRHVASRQVRTRLDTRLADFEHDPEHLSGGGANPRGTVWATINRLTKTLSSASASSPMAAGERLRPVLGNFVRRLAQLVVFTRRRTPKLSANGSRFVWTVFDRDVALQNPGSHDCCFRHRFSIVHHAVFMT